MQKALVGLFAHGYIFFGCFLASGVFAADHISPVNPRLVLKPFSAPVISLTVSNKSRMMAVGDGEKSVRIYNVEDGSTTTDIAAPRVSFGDLLFSPDGKSLAIGCNDGSLWLRDLTQRGQWQPMIKLRHNLGSDRSNFRVDSCLTLAHSQFGPEIAAGHDFSLRLWSEQDRRQVFERSVGHGASSVCFTDDGSTIAIGSSWGEVSVVDVASGKLRRFGDGHTRRVTSMVFAQGGRRLITASLDHRAIVWDARSGKRIQALHEKSEDGCYDRIYAFKYLEAEDLLLTISSDSCVRLWSAEEGKLRQRITLNSLDHEIAERAVDVLERPFTVAIGMLDGTAILFEIQEHIKSQR